MTGSAATLVNLGIAPLPAEVIGDTISQNIAGIGTAQVGAAVLTGTVNTVTTASSQTAFILKAHNAGRRVLVWNQSATAAAVFPPTGATINTSSANASFSVAQNKVTEFIFITPLIICAVLSN